jgi:UDP-3-O-[3-hydroxymyristoyl] N-acetylglucosamine deacetylase
VADVPARWDAVSDTMLGSTIANAAGTEVKTVEHLMAALAVHRVDNALLELTGPEIPVMDGSSRVFSHLIRSAGTRPQGEARKTIRVTKEVAIAEGDKWARLTPAEAFEVALEIVFDSAAIGRQSVHVVPETEGECAILPARTFGFAHEIEELRAMGLARGGSLDNAILVEGDRIVNDGGLRLPEEFVRHKALDLVGDLYLAGAPIRGRIDGFKTGHALNNALLAALFAAPDAWEWA